MYGLDSLHTSPIGSEVANGALHNECLLGKPWYAVLAQGPLHSLLSCKNSSLVKCGYNSVHISLA